MLPALASSCAPHAGNGAGMKLCRARAMRRPGLSAVMGKARQGWCCAELAALGALFLPLLQVDVVRLTWAAHPSAPQRSICSLCS